MSAGRRDTAASCPFFDQTRGARNKTKNVAIHDNEFRFTKAGVDCTNTLCGRNSLSELGCQPELLRRCDSKAITFKQNNKWYNNVYYGEWHFQPFDMGSDRTFAEWQAAPYSQDTGSTYSATVPQRQW